MVDHRSNRVLKGEYNTTNTASKIIREGNQLLEDTNYRERTVLNVSMPAQYKDQELISDCKPQGLKQSCKKFQRRKQTLRS